MNGRVPNDANRHDDVDSIDDCAPREVLLELTMHLEWSHKKA